MVPVACRLPGSKSDDPHQEIQPAATAATVPRRDAGSPTAGSGTPVVLEAPVPKSDAQPRGAQTLTLVGTPSGPATLDPALIRDADSGFVARQVFRGLVRVDDELKPVPDLARRIEISPDGLTYTFELWDNSTFDNGRRVTAEDVKKSFERATDPALVGGDGTRLPARTYLSDIVGAKDRMAGTTETISGVEAVDPGTVRIQLERPVANFLLKLTGTPAFIVDEQNATSGPDWWRKPIGSGPFALTEWRDNDRIVLKGHKGYEPQPPTLQTVEILIGTGAFQPMNLYERGQIDATNVSVSSIDRLESPNDPLHAELHTSPLLSVSYIVLNPNVAPLDNPKVRQALIQSFDRSKIATVMFGGHVKAINGLLPDGLLGRDWPAKMPPYDLGAGKALLKSALGDQAPSLSIYTGSADTPVAMKKVFERDLGMDVDVIQPDWVQFLGDLTQRKLQAFSLNWVADYPDPEAFLRELFASDSPDNYLGYKNPEVDRLLDEAEIEPDAERRAQLYEQAQQAIIDDNVVIPLYEDASYVLVKPYVHGMSVTPLGILGLESVWVTK